MNLRKLGRMVGWMGLFFSVVAIVLTYLLFFTDVLDSTQERVMYTCTACLKSNPARCKKLRMDWWSNPTALKTEKDVRESIAFDLCREVVPEEQDDKENICGDWVLHRPDEIFDFNCTSRLERRKKTWYLGPH